MHRNIFVLPAVVMSVPAQAQSMLGNEKCTALVQEGMTLVSQNKFNEALAKFQEAGKADPQASGPLSGRAMAFFLASKLTTDENVQSYRNEAEQCAKAALQRQPKDVLANETLRLLAEGLDPERHTPTPEARAAVQAGEALFGNNRFDEALKKYEEAIRLDPVYADALVYAGDCHFAQGKHSEAESYFRRATAVDLLHERAWRFLADALLKQGKVAQAREALFGAISARPSSKAAWNKLSEVSLTAGQPWKVFQVVPKARAVLDEKTKKTTIQIDPSATAECKKDAPTPDFGAWIAYGLAQVAKRLPPKPGEAQKTICEVEVDIWDSTLKAMEEMEDSTKVKAKDPSLLQMQVFRKAGDLQAAIFLLMFKETFRPDFETWKKGHPGAVKAFIEKYQLQP